MLGKRCKITNLSQKQVVKGWIAEVGEHGIWISKKAIPNSAFKRWYHSRPEEAAIDNYKHHFFSW